MARALTLTVALALVGLAVAITAFVVTRPRVPALWASGPARVPSSAGATVAGRLQSGPDGRQPSVAAAMRELELVSPPGARAAEDFALPMPDGRQFRLSDHRGKVVFINFWATWCPPCREEMPSMERLFSGQKDRAFSMVAVSLDASPAAVTPYLAQGGFTFPVALDPRMDLASAYGVRALPASFIVDPRGVIVAVALGPRDWDAPAARALMEGVAR